MALPFFFEQKFGFVHISQSPRKAGEIQRINK